MIQGSDRDERWQVPYRIILSDHLYYIQVEFGDCNWCTLSAMVNTGHKYEFGRYRNWTTIKEILKWWKNTNRTNILTSHVWMPSKALYDIDVVSDYKQILEDYPEELI